MDIKKFEPLWDCWYVKECIGEGSFGKVYRIERKEFDNVYVAALKHIRIPQSQSEIKSVMADGMDEASVEKYYEKIVKDIVKEIELMSKLKGNSHVVSYEDHKCVKAEDGICWDIFIRMELLTSLLDYIQSRTITKKDIIKLGIDICKALELCQKHNIIHRDIKPENIFVSENCDFKLGDFGIARQIEATVADMSKKGTYTYIAPEVYKGEEYGTTVDIYSLGIVMYRLLNNNRTPFMPPYPEPISHLDREISLVKRMSGQPIPPPTNSTGRLTEIVLKACAFDPKERYHSPLVMRADLEAILYDSAEAKVIYPEGDSAEIKSVNYVETQNEETKPINATVDFENAKTELMPKSLVQKQVDGTKTGKDTSQEQKALSGTDEKHPVNRISEFIGKYKLPALIAAVLCAGAIGISVTVNRENQPAVSVEQTTVTSIEITTEVITEAVETTQAETTTNVEITTQMTTAVPTTQAVPVVQQPVQQEPVRQTQPVQRTEPKTQPVTQAPVVQAPVVQEPVVQEPVTQAPVTQPVTEASVQITAPPLDTSEAPPIVIGFD